MKKVNFKNATLEKQYRNFKWSRNNSILLFDAAVSEDMLAYAPANSFSVLHQFQCIVATTDAYYRKLNSADNQGYGILVKDSIKIEKKDISLADVTDYLKKQLFMLEAIFKDYNDNDFEANIKTIQIISNHEYLHQGQLVVMFRESGIKFPDRFKTAFAL